MHKDNVYTGDTLEHTRRSCVRQTDHNLAVSEVSYLGVLALHQVREVENILHSLPCGGRG